MVAHILRLRLQLFLGVFQGSSIRKARVGVGLALLTAIVVLGCIGVLSLSGEPADVTTAVLTLFGAASLLGFAVGPVLAAVPDQLDPRRFAVLGPEPRPLAWSLVLASLVSVPSLALLAVDICTAIVWIRVGVPEVVAVLSALVHVITCVLLARLGMAFAAVVLRGRRTREMSGLFVLGVVVVVMPVAVFLGSMEWNGRVPTQVRGVIEFLTLTPFGAAAGAPGAIALGRPVTAWLATFIGLITAALAVLCWVWLVRRLLSAVENPVEVSERGGLGWFAVLPGNAAGAIAARSIVYWFRDTRYLANLAIIPVVGLLPIIPLLIAGVSPQITALVPVPIMALFFGWVAHNDIAYDATAVWMHIVSGVGGMADRIGRIVPVLMATIPVLAVAVPISVAFYDRWAILPGMVGVAAALFLTGLGLSCISSVVPYAVPRPGDGPFQQPQRTGSVGIWSQALVMAGSVVLSAPALWFCWLAVTADVSYAIVALWTGLVTGIVVLTLGIVGGGKLFERREARIMEFASMS